MNPYAGISFDEAVQTYMAGTLPLPAPVTGTGATFAIHPNTKAAWQASIQASIEDTERRQDADRKLQLKLFVHFAKIFVEKNNKWSLVPEPEDVFGKVRLIMPSLGISISSLYPFNELAIYGGPHEWTEKHKELGQTLPIVKITPQTFFGWALDVDTPEWVK